MNLLNVIFHSISGITKIILRTQAKLSLTCMAAKAIKTYNLPYRGNVPRSLESFIELHGPGSESQNQSWWVFNIAILKLKFYGTKKCARYTF